MNIYLEIFGYIGSGLIILSMMMKSLKRLRIVNMSGSVISIIYAILSNAWPVVTLNVFLIIVNAYELIKGMKLVENKEDPQEETQEERKVI